MTMDPLREVLIVDVELEPVEQRSEFATRIAQKIFVPDEVLWSWVLGEQLQEPGPASWRAEDP